MYHYARRTLPETWLFHSWTEARWLWSALRDRVPGIVALVLMPDHLHLLTRRRVDEEVGRALRSYAMRRSRRTGSGPSFRRGDVEPSEVKGRLKEQRNVRYVALNPCRAGLVGDPLAWAFSSHRDALGYALSPIVPAVPDRLRLHSYVCADDFVGEHALELPYARCGAGTTVEQLRDAVSALTRHTFDELEQPGAPRNLLLAAAGELVPGGTGQLARELGCHRSTMVRARDRVPAAHIRKVELVLGDARFKGLDDADLRRRFRRRGPF